jgi:hypothetical protein
MVPAHPLVCKVGGIVEGQDRFELRKMFGQPGASGYLGTILTCQTTRGVLSVTFGWLIDALRG